MDIYPREYGASTDSAGAQLIAELIKLRGANQLERAYLFCEFPLFREEDGLIRSQLLLVSPVHGVLIVGTTLENTAEGIKGLIPQTEAIFSHIYSKLLRISKLRASKTKLNFGAEAAIFAPEFNARENFEDHDDVKICTSITSFIDYLESLRSDAPLDEDMLLEIVSVVEGSKGLIRPIDRQSHNFPADSKVALIKKLDEEIRRFDREQRLGYMTEVLGLERITGLAGSGKTVVLAMKAAMAHLNNPEARIAFTFYTKSLYQQIKQLITRFYRQFDDRDPDWDKLKIMHAWGGQVNDGLYYYAAKASGAIPLTYPQARSFNSRRPFDYACTRLLEGSNLVELFDYIFIDEAQDFPPSFLRLALKVVKDEKLVIAYDVFQTIFDVEIPSAEVLFGKESAVSFMQDIVLHKCYRNPLEVLVTAHAIGFGIYSKRIVQMLESADHWRDFGYELESGKLTSGQNVVITRPLANSPSSISNQVSSDAIISAKSFGGLTEEIDYVSTNIKSDIEVDGLLPEDILVICADDMNSRTYFKHLSRRLAEDGIRTNNLQEDTYEIRNFTEKGEVTLSTVYKAKGNEAFAVYVTGIDALFSASNARNRNTAFVAMTRAKGWLKISGVGAAAEKFTKEVDSAKTELPKLKFTFPSPEELISLKRDLSEEGSERVSTTLDDLEFELSPDQYEVVLKRKLMDVQRKKRSQKKKY